VVHDLNNHLAIIQCNAIIVEKLLHGAEPRIIESLQDIVDAVAAATRLTRSVQALGQRGGIGPAAVDVGAIIGDAARLLRKQLPQTLELVLPAEPVRALITGPYLQQVILNLLVNARDALPKDGIISVTLALDGPSITLTVADNGPGLPAEVQARLFQPFVTTQPGRRTWLGLAVVRQLVTRLGGTILVETNASGTRFVMQMPLVMELGKAPLAGQRVLVAATAAVTSVTVDALTSRGASVVSVNDGASALIAAERERFNVVVVENGLPDTDGATLLNSLRAKRALTTAVLLSSGVAPDLAESLGVQVVWKPFSADELLAVVERAIVLAAGAS